MATFRVRSRKIGPVTLGDVVADSREHAIQMAIDRAEEGESIEVLDAQELTPDMVAGSTGATGATGPASRK